MPAVIWQEQEFDLLGALINSTEQIFLTCLDYKILERLVKSNFAKRVFELVGLSEAFSRKNPE